MYQLYLQTGLSVQFDDLFKKAWEEDVAELEKDGMCSPHLEFSLWVDLYVKY